MGRIPPQNGNGIKYCSCKMVTAMKLPCQEFQIRIREIKDGFKLTCFRRVL